MRQRLGSEIRRHGFLEGMFSHIVQISVRAASLYRPGSLQKQLKTVVNPRSALYPRQRAYSGLLVGWPARDGPQRERHWLGILSRRCCSLPARRPALPGVSPGALS
jgi:hypothetical protein